MYGSKTLVAGALALALAACGDNNSTMTDGGSGDMAERPNAAGGTEDQARGAAAMTETPPAMSATGATPAGGAQLAEGDRTALMQVMEVDRHEITAAESAIAKDVQGDVRAYADALLRDHTRNLEATRTLLGADGGHTGHEMTTVAGGTASTTEPATVEGGEAPAEVAAMRDKHEAKERELEAMSGAAFEKAWVAAMVAGHQEALDTLDAKLIPGATEDRVRTHLQTTREAIAGHLETARRLQQS